jgi:hypothetical protein
MARDDLAGQVKRLTRSLDRVATPPLPLSRCVSLSPLLALALGHLSRHIESNQSTPSTCANIALGLNVQHMPWTTAALDNCYDSHLLLACRRTDLGTVLVLRHLARRFKWSRLAWLILEREAEEVSGQAMGTTTV